MAEIYPESDGSDGGKKPNPGAGADYKSTLNLPQTSFDMKANLTHREPVMLAEWKKDELYKRIRRRSHPLGKWLLHDGPPYASGDIHMGHLINKVLKDVVVKYRTMQGYDAPFVPGWDCHGLPIESAIQKQLGPKMRELSADDIRRRCRDYAMKFVGQQGESFERLGVMGSFDRPYLTLDPRYEAGVLDVLADLLRKDMVFRQRKPVHWCTFDQTALAEAELEYANRSDASVFVYFHLRPGAWPEQWGDAPSENSPGSVLIWTTTPWTLPANRAVAVHPEHEYVCVRFEQHGPKAAVVARRLVEPVMTRAGITDYAVSGAVTGATWCAMQPRYEHPLDTGRQSPVVSADYVTLEDGTGLVHTAPGHGAEDYMTGRRAGLEVYCPVLPDGRYDQSVPEFLRGQLIWNANQEVVDKLAENGLLFFKQTFDHSYPHCWRCRKPTILRATEQWFVRAGAGSSLVQTARKFVDKTRWIPEWGKNRISGMLETRPDWCISRQRYWGVPIPWFFLADGRVLLSEKSVRRVAEYVRSHGADSWFTDLPGQILGAAEWDDLFTAPDGQVGPDKASTAELRKGADILDVWFESGASHRAVLSGTHPELGYPADMYLEGSDQHRGWFQASLLEAAGYLPEPPFREILTHGFIVDSNGRKMSKSEGNDIKVADALKENGADILRLWVSSVDYQNDMPCSRELFARTGEAYRKIRNTIRYLLGNLYDFDIQIHATRPAAASIDNWMLGRLAGVYAEVHAAYQAYELHRVFRGIYEFCNVDISAVYAKAIKDRLYCELPDGPRRRASQTVCRQILVHLIEMTAPVLCFTADEAWQAVLKLPGMQGQPKEHIHERIFSELPKAPDRSLAAPWEILMPLVDSGLKQLDNLKRSVGLGNPLDAMAVLVVPPGHSMESVMGAYGPEVEDALGVGYHRVEHGELWNITIHDTRQRYASCARSWKRRPDVGSDPRYPDLSARDAAVVQSLAKHG